MPNVYAYLRVSHLDSAESGLSIASQREQALRYLEYKRMVTPDLAWGPTGWIGQRLQGEFTKDGFFVDQAVSAFKKPLRARPAGARLAGAVRRGDHVIFPIYDRGFRILRDFLELWELWDTIGVMMHFIDMQLDLSSPAGRLMAQVRGAFAEFDSRLKSSRSREVARYMQSIGRPINGQRPIGWKRVPGVKIEGGPCYIPDDAEREIVRQIVELRESGLVWQKISDLIEGRLAEAEGRPVRRVVPFKKGEEKRYWTWARCQKAYEKAHEFGIERGELPEKRKRRRKCRDEEE